MSKTINDIQLFLMNLVKNFRHKLEQSNIASKVSDNPDQLVIVPINSRQNQSEGEGDEAMLDLIISDVQRGVDIEKKYPNFYKKMLANPELYQLFLDVLDTLEKEKVGELVVPTLELPTAQFIQAIQSVPEGPNIKHISSKNVQIEWFFKRAQLDRYIKSQELVFREAVGYPQNKRIRILHNKVDVDGFGLYITLDMIRPVENRSLFQLQLGILSDFEQEINCSEISGQAIVSWGSYRGEGNIGEDCLVSFPPFPVDVIYDELDQTIIADFGLTLELSLP